jgi:hypothetical protein
MEPRDTRDAISRLIVARLGALLGDGVDSVRPTPCALAAPPPIDGNHIVAETGVEKGTISLDAKRRPLQARVGREH